MVLGLGSTVILPGALSVGLRVEGLQVYRLPAAEDGMANLLRMCS
jgi:hypothetical protein